MKMRLLFLPILSSIVILMGCINVNKSNNKLSNSKNTSSINSDTIICSLPTNILEDLDTVNPSRKIVFNSYKDVLDLFDTLNYTPAAWQEGIRVVPRVYLPKIGDKWGLKTSKEISVQYKKQLFFRGLAPLILHANELILCDRTHLENIKKSYTTNSSISEKDSKWILNLGKAYKVNVDNNQVTNAMLEELWKRVDIIPISLALAQAAEESGWGTSRFAAKGNSIYGQWSWGKDAITPENQRKELGNYGIAAFETLQQSVSAYMLNLNTHSAYSSLRNKRAELRSNNNKVTGYILAGQLTKYSERGEEYVKSLRSLMDYNKLNPADDAYLAKELPIYLIAASE